MAEAEAKRSRALRELQELVEAGRPVIYTMPHVSPQGSAERLPCLPHLARGIAPNVVAPLLAVVGDELGIRLHRNCEVVSEFGLDVEIREVEIHDQEDALRRQFLGSPSVRVDGVDIEPGAAERTEYAFGCRLYGARGVPPRDYLVRALQGGERE